MKSINSYSQEQVALRTFQQSYFKTLGKILISTPNLFNFIPQYQIV